jgi:hypothetical protein
MPAALPSASIFKLASGNGHCSFYLIFLGVTWGGQLHFGDLN